MSARCVEPGCARDARAYQSAVGEAPTWCCEIHAPAWGLPTYSLPNGQTARMPETQARAVWAWWRAIARLAAARGEGVRVYRASESEWGIATVYAPRPEAIRVEIGRAGEATWLGEPGAPDVTPDPRPAPWVIP